jgi:hypothetical protein
MIESVILGSGELSYKLGNITWAVQPNGKAINSN